MISQFQKDIYNHYLRAFRVNNNNPFRPKKNFDNVKNIDVVALDKLERLFSKHPHLYKKEFFDAPYKIYTDKSPYYSLAFYASYKGITACSSYFNWINKLKPDDDAQFTFIKDSFKFIIQFCLEHKIHLGEYVNYCPIAQNECFKHLKEHKISWYIVFAIPYLYDKLYRMPLDEFELYFGDLSLNNMFTNYVNSKIARPYMENKIKKIENFILKRLKTL